MPSCASTASVAVEPEATAMTGLVARFGSDIALPDLLVAVASCESPAGLHSPMRRKVHGLGQFGGGALRAAPLEAQMGDAASRIGWGVVLGGDAFDLEDWREALKQPFDPLDPWVTETKFGLILRSSQLTAKPRRARLTSAPRRMRSTAAVKLETFDRARRE